jgi:hypothetical protein
MHPPPASHDEQSNLRAWSAAELASFFGLFASRWALPVLHALDEAPGGPVISQPVTSRHPLRQSY